MTQRDYAAGGLNPDGLPRVGHWRRRPRRRSIEAFTPAPDAAEPLARAARSSVPWLSPLDATVIPDGDSFPRRGRDGSVAAPDPAPPANLVHDLIPAGRTGAATLDRSDRRDYGLGRTWGATWRWTAQGWIDRDGPDPTWRPVVSTTSEVSHWEHDTYLGVVAGEAAVTTVDDAATLGEALAEARDTALRGLVDAGVSRGAHAVVGVSVDYTEVRGRVVVTATGTAVTLRDR